MLSFNYVNSYGYNKIIRVFTNKKNEKGEYYCELWSGQNDTMEATGMYCGSKYMSVKDLNEYFEHFGIDYRFS